MALGGGWGGEVYLVINGPYKTSIEDLRCEEVLDC